MNIQNSDAKDTDKTKKEDSLADVKLQKIYKIIPRVILGVIVVILVFSGLFLLSDSVRYMTRARFIETDQWQAVFVDNNQVYFGKLTISNDFFILDHVYYLQAGQRTGDLDSADAALDIEGEMRIDTKLIKLGNEIHGPEDQMFIERSKVLFWENMKDEASIVRSIKDYEKQIQ